MKSHFPDIEFAKSTSMFLVLNAPGDLEASLSHHNPLLLPTEQLNWTAGTTVCFLVENWIQNNDFVAYIIKGIINVLSFQ